MSMSIGRGATLRKGYKAILGNVAQDVRIASPWSIATEQPCATRPRARPFQSLMASGDDSRSQTQHSGSKHEVTKGKGRQHTTQRFKRPTHFVCLPLVTESSIPQLSDSLAFFRSVTTHFDRDAMGTGGRETVSQAQHGSDMETGSGSGRRDDTLRLIPRAAHRPPGTFHLTLGAMDLSNPQDLERALQLLESIDYLDLLAEAGKSLGDSHDASTRTRTGEGELSTESHHTDGSNSPIRAGGETGNQGHSVAEGSGSGKGSVQATAETLAKPLKSLSRAISPPPTSKAFKHDGDNDNTTRTSSGLDAKGQRLQSSPMTLTVTLHGLGTFPRPSSSRVFFAHADEDTGRLLPFGNLVRRRFQDAGLVTETRALVLHATVANLIYVKRTPMEKGKGRGRGDGMTVDARDVLRYFNDGKAVEDRAAEREQDQKEGGSLSVLSTAAPDSSSRYIWARDILVDRIRICKMGAETSEIEGWGMEYKPVGEKVFGS